MRRTLVGAAVLSFAALCTWVVLAGPAAGQDRVPSWVPPWYATCEDEHLEKDWFELFGAEEYGSSLKKVNIRSFATQVVHDLPDQNDDTNSIRWNLAKGVVVIFFEHEKKHLIDDPRPFKQLPVFGRMCIPQTRKFKMVGGKSEGISSWMWIEPHKH